MLSISVILSSLFILKISAQTRDPSYEDPSFGFNRGDNYNRNYDNTGNYNTRNDYNPRVNNYYNQPISSNYGLNDNLSNSARRADFYNNYLNYYNNRNRNLDSSRDNSNVSYLNGSHINFYTPNRNQPEIPTQPGEPFYPTTKPSVDTHITFTNNRPNTLSNGNTSNNIGSSFNNGLNNRPNVYTPNNFDSSSNNGVNFLPNNGNIPNNVGNSFNNGINNRPNNVNMPNNFGSSSNNGINSLPNNGNIPNNYGSSLNNGLNNLGVNNIPSNLPSNFSNTNNTHITFITPNNTSNSVPLYNTETVTSVNLTNNMPAFNDSVNNIILNTNRTRNETLSPDYPNDQPPMRVGGFDAMYPYGNGYHSSSQPKSGSCPPLTQVYICDNTCFMDSHCEGVGKCCPTACGGAVCTRPVSEKPVGGVKPGQCPVRPTGPWVCTSRCAEDSDCRGKFKCCKNRCGAYACQKPED